MDAKKGLKIAGHHLNSKAGTMNYYLLKFALH